MANAKKTCPQCGKPLPPRVKFCPHCGCSLQQTTDRVYVFTPEGQRSKLIAALLAFFLGVFGIHNFYLGKSDRAIAQLLISVIGGLFTCGIASSVIYIWAFAEGILILTGSPGYEKDGRGLPLGS